MNDVTILNGAETKTVVLEKDVEFLMLHGVRADAYIKVTLRREGVQDEVLIDKAKVSTVIESQQKILALTQRVDVTQKVYHAAGNGTAYRCYSHALVRLTKVGEYKLIGDDVIIIELTSLGKIDLDSFIKPLQGFAGFEGFTKLQRHHFNLSKGIKALDVSAMDYVVFLNDDSKMPDEIVMWKGSDKKVFDRETVKCLQSINYGHVTYSIDEGDLKFGSFAVNIIDVTGLRDLELMDETNETNYDFYSIK